MGKSTLAKLVNDRPVFGSDAYRNLPWTDVPLKIISDIGELPAFVVEGVQVPRALRKGLAVDVVVYLTRPKVTERLKGQVSMAVGCRTVFDEWHAKNRELPVYFEGLKDEALSLLSHRSA